MKKTIKQFISTLLVAIMFISSSFIVDFQLKADALTTVNTGNSIIDKYLNTALSMEGYSQSYFGVDVAWCGYFSWWCANKAGLTDYFQDKAFTWNGDEIIKHIGDKGGKGYYFWDDMYDSKEEDTYGLSFESRSTFVPKPGDIVVVRTSSDSAGINKKQRWAHVAIVYKVTDSNIYVVHGNWNNKVVVGTAFSRSGSSYYSGSYYTIAGYARPAYNSYTEPPTKAEIAISKKVVKVNEKEEISYHSDYANEYWIGIYKDNVLFNQAVTSEEKYSISYEWVGKYDVVIVPKNSCGDGETAYMSFYVGNTGDYRSQISSISLSKKVVKTNEKEEISYHSDYANEYWIGIYKDNVLFNQAVTSEEKYSISYEWVGKYDVVIVPKNSCGDGETAYMSFYVGNTGDYSPQISSISLSKKVVEPNETEIISYHSDYANEYWIGIYKEGVLFNQAATSEEKYSISYEWIGKYDVVVVPKNSCSDGETAYISFYVDHTSDTGTVTKAATCTSTGIKTFKCTACGEILKTETIAKTAHSFENTVVAPKCSEQGYTIHICKSCGYDTVDSYIPPTGHTDKNHDGKCDNCGASTGTNIPTQNCSCNCHKSGFIGFIWKIQNFFNKIFKKNPVCACGAKHY